MAILFVIVTSKKVSSISGTSKHLASIPRRLLFNSYHSQQSCKMRPELRRAATILSTSHRLSTSTVISSTSSVRCFHCATRTWAIAHPITAHGPPPKAPTPAAEFKDDPRRAGLDQQKAPQQQQESQTRPSDRTATPVSQAKTSPLKKRFWKDVDVKESAGMMMK